MSNIFRIGSTKPVSADKTTIAGKKESKKTNGENSTAVKKRDIVELGSRPESYVYTKAELKSGRVASITRQMAEKTSENMRRLVREVIQNQGSSSLAAVLEANDIELAKTAISEDADFGIMAVSDRIVDFAVSLAGSDPEKLAMMKDAIEEGFELARKAFGGTLPDICEKTHDEIMRRMDALISGEDNA